MITASIVFGMCMSLGLLGVALQKNCAFSALISAGWLVVHVWAMVKLYS